MDKKIDEYLKVHKKTRKNPENGMYYYFEEYRRKYYPEEGISKTGDESENASYLKNRFSRVSDTKNKEKIGRGISKYRKKCKLCGGSTDTDPICINCQLALFQMEELKRVLLNSLKNKEKPPEWSLKASLRISEILSTYPTFNAYKNLIGDVVYIFLTDDNAVISGVDPEGLPSLISTTISNSEILSELSSLDIIEITNNRRVFPGKLLQLLIDLRRVYAESFASREWELYTSAVHTVCIIDLTKKRILDYLKERGRNPKQILTIFKILSKVIQDNIDKKDQSTFYIHEIELNTILFLLNKNSRMRFLEKIIGIDGKSKLIEDFTEDEDTKSLVFKIHHDFSGYITHMIERLREVERERGER